MGSSIEICDAFPPGGDAICGVYCQVLHLLFSFSKCGRSSYSDVSAHAYGQAPHVQGWPRCNEGLLGFIDQDFNILSPTGIWALWTVSPTRGEPFMWIVIWLPGSLTYNMFLMWHRPMLIVWLFQMPMRMVWREFISWVSSYRTSYRSIYPWITLLLCTWPATRSPIKGPSLSISVTIWSETKPTTGWEHPYWTQCCWRSD